MNIMIGFISKVLDFLGWGTPLSSSSSPYQVAEVYQGLRKQVFEFELEDTRSDSESSVRGLLMETGRPEAIVSLLALKDGTVSLFFSHGGGILGLGQHEGPLRVSQELLQMVPQFLSEFKTTSDFSLPVPGRIKFFVFTVDEILSLDSKEEDMENNRLNIAPLFYKADELITQIRIVDENRNGKAATKSDN